MATLYVENIPDDLYEALRNRARQHRKSLAGEVLSLLEENVPTAAELRRRRRFLSRVRLIRSQKRSVGGGFPTTERMQREDRER
jgi:plasmid stability protein